MTSFPIIWYSIYDFEHEKDRPEKKTDSEENELPVHETEVQRFIQGDENYFLRNPELYKPGMEGSCFGTKVMAKWILYALWHAYVVYLVAFRALTLASDGYSSPL